MRPTALAVVALVSAVLGGVAVLAVGAAAGWIGEPRTETVVVEPAAVPADVDEPRAVAAPAAPLTGNGFDPARLYAARAPGVVTVYALFGEHAQDGQAAQGSGFVVSGDGYVLTNAHVVTDAGERPGADVRPAARLFVEFTDGERVPAELVGWDVYVDVGVLRVDPKRHPLTPLPLGDSSRVVVGEPVAAIGSPFGEQSSLSVGVVSATGRAIDSLTAEPYDIIDAIQIDAPINRGNSGGPLFDARGRVIGINAQIRSTSGTAEGVGFAVPINAARRSMRQLIESGRVPYAYVGITTDDLTPGIARRLGYAASRGALIVDVKPGPARRAGLRGGSKTVELEGRELTTGGDVVVAIDGRRVRSGADLVRIVTGRLHPGQVATFTIVRGAQRLNVPVRLAERPDDPS